MNISRFEIILYVAHQQRSTEFYSTMLEQQPTLYVEGMTEFTLQPNLILGLMPESGIATILKGNTPHPATGTGIPRCELYVDSTDPILDMQRSLLAGATLVSDVQPRNWGDDVGYIADPDGHIIAFAKRSNI
ncbi:MAG: lactoylglutathione lyase [Candidatus Kapaibacterium sp.]|nr:lactoylglutathione lyase [Bacteroidota bacterium]